LEKQNMRKVIVGSRQSALALTQTNQVIEQLKAACGRAGLPPGARVGTSSLRRSAQLAAYRPDLAIEPIRGNIDTRLRKLETDGLDAVVLAAAGLHRMGWADRISEYVPPDICVPAVAQGALGIECREDDTFMRELLGMIDDAETALAVRAERRFLGRLNGGCQIPIGAYAVLRRSGRNEDGALPTIEMNGVVGSPDGKRIIRERAEGTDPERLGDELAERMLSRGADRILAEWNAGG
jgi:hydroxymethylbilane synthase